MSRCSRNAGGGRIYWGEEGVELEQKLPFCAALYSLHLIMSCGWWLKNKKVNASNQNVFCCTVGLIRADMSSSDIRSRDDVPLHQHRNHYVSLVVRSKVDPGHIGGIIIPLPKNVLRVPQVSPVMATGVSRWLFSVCMTFLHIKGWKWSVLSGLSGLMDTCGWKW